MGKNSCPLPAGSLVWAYARDSGGEDQDIQSQKSAVLEYVERHNLVLQRLFVDEARPGSSVVGREAFEEMIYLSKKEPRPVDAILLWSFSRFARNLLDAQFYRADLRRRGYEIISMSDDLPGGDFDPIIEALIDWKNERYLKDLSCNVKRGLHDLAKQGFAPGGFPPRGYKVEKVQIGVKRNAQPRYASKWVPDPRYWQRVQRAFEMWAHGASLMDIHKATHLFSSRYHYSYMFKNQTYWGKRKCGDLVVDSAHPPIADIETLRQIDARNERERMEKRRMKGKAHPRVRGSRYLLSGLVRCAYCGSAMIGSITYRANKRGKPYRHYVCGKKLRLGSASCEGKRIATKTLDTHLLQIVLGRILTPNYLTDLLDEVNAELTKSLVGVEEEIHETQRQITRLDRAIEALLNLAEKEGSEAAGERLLKRETERRSLSVQLRSLLARKEEGRIEIEPQTLRHIVGEMHDTLNGRDVKAQRAMLQRFVQKVEVERQKGRLYYTFPLADSLYVKYPRGSTFYIYSRSGFCLSLSWGRISTHYRDIDETAPTERDSSRQRCFTQENPLFCDAIELIQRRALSSSDPRTAWVNHGLQVRVRGGDRTTA